MTPDGNTGLLAGLRVLDLSASIAGQFATRIMADNGADVALVEPVEGSATRRMGPFRDGGDGGSLLFWHLNGGKQSIALECGGPVEATAWDRVRALGEAADCIVTDDPELARRIEAQCPQAVVGLITPFGSTGPYASWRGSEMIFQALSGSMYVTGAPDREPLYGVGQRASYAAGLWLYVAMMAALVGGVRHGRRYGPVEVTLHEAAAAMEENFSMRWAYSSELMLRGNDPSRSVCTLECSDGHAILFLRTAPGQWKALCRIIGGEELIADERFASWSALSRNWFEAVDELNRRTRAMTVAALVAGGETSGLVIAAVETPQSLRGERHLRERGYWQAVATKEGERLALGALVNIHNAPAVRNRAAPDVGSADRWPADPPPAPEAITQRAPADGPRPLEGVSVLDFTTAWAGPMATKILAVLGADVIKIEGPQWLDSWRGPLRPTNLEQYPGKVPGPRPWNCCARFNAQNHDKRDVVLDLKSGRAQNLIRAMVPRMDLVVANFRPGALARIGLDYKTMAGLNPRLSMVEMPAVGEGPFAHRIGLGPTMEAMAGIAGCIGYRDGPPLGSGSSYLDPMGALHAAAACLTALYGQLTRGTGSSIEVAQREAAMQWIGEILLAHADGDAAPARCGNAIAEAAPHNAYRASGADQWIAIAVFTDAQWLSLCAVLAQPALAADGRFATAAGRVARRDDLDRLIGGLTRDFDKFELAARLQAAGVPAAPVANGGDVFRDPHLRARGWFTSLTHPDAGTHEHAGLPLVFGGVRYLARRASPGFGEHTREVLAAYARLSDDALDALAAAGITSAEPKDGEHFSS